MLFPFFSGYDASKVSSSNEAMTARLDEIKVGAPDWFKWEAGFLFNKGNTPCVLLGFGGHREVEPMAQTAIAGEAAYRLIFYKAHIMYAWFYKGEWHLSSIEKNIADKEWDWSEIVPWLEGD